MKTVLTFGPGSFSTPALSKQLVLDSRLEKEVSKQFLKNKECGEQRKSLVKQNPKGMCAVDMGVDTLGPPEPQTQE